MKWLAFFVVLEATASAFAEVPHEIAHEIPQMTRGPYAQALDQIVKRWSANPGVPWTQAAAAPGQRASLQCWSFPDRPLYIGVSQQFVIQAPLDRVEAVLDDFQGYVRIFDGLVKSEVLQRSGPRLVLATEQRIPLPFVPNDRTQMIYELDKTSEKVKVYRYQLKQSNHLTAYDGLIVLEKVSATQTRYTEFDFWDADWGFAKVLGDKKIWKDSLVAVLQTDFAVQLRAENPAWTAEKVLKESMSWAGEFPVALCYEGRRQFPF